jgi:multidrug efflux pump subunit AcrA (membrane-fusion protein)
MPKLFLSYTYVTAPYDGWVGKKTIQEGQLIKEGQALVQIVSKEKWIIANYKETQLDKSTRKKSLSPQMRILMWNLKEKSFRFLLLQAPSFLW